jgi:hypothetical protein
VARLVPVDELERILPEGVPARLRSANGRPLPILVRLAPNERIEEARVHADMPGVVFVFNGLFWTAVRREEIAHARIPRVVAVGRDGKKRACRDEALRGEC